MLVITILIKFLLLLVVRHLFLVASYPPPPRAREKVLVDFFASNYKCIASSNKCLTGSNKKLVITILIVTSKALVSSSFLPPPRARAKRSE